jgi:VWFA-related protein
MKTLIVRFYRTLIATLVLLLVVSPFQPAFAQEAGSQIRITQVDNSKFPQVTVYVSVTDAKGEPLAVAPEQIQINENGKLMTPDQISGSGEIGPLTTLLVVDVSGSMNYSGKIAAAKTAANAYVDQMRPGDQAGLLTFNTQISYSQTITTDRAALKQAIAALNPAGNTAMFDALTQAEQTLQGIPGRKAIIVMTDGIDNVSQHKAGDVIQAIGTGGLSISTVGFGNPDQASGVTGLDVSALQSRANQAGGVYGYANDPGTLLGIYEHLGHALQSEYRITYTSPLTLRDGLNRTLTVSLGGAASAQGRYNPGGVLPEVSGAVSWPIFGLMLAGLLVLLFAPMLVNRLRAIPGNNPFAPKKKVHIKLK